MAVNLLSFLGCLMNLNDWDLPCEGRTLNSSRRCYVLECMVGVLTAILRAYLLRPALLSSAQLLPTVATCYHSMALSPLFHPTRQPSYWPLAATKGALIGCSPVWADC